MACNTFQFITAVSHITCRGGQDLVVSNHLVPHSKSTFRSVPFDGDFLDLTCDDIILSSRELTRAEHFILALEEKVEIVCRRFFGSLRSTCMLADYPPGRYQVCSCLQLVSHGRKLRVDRRITDASVWLLPLDFFTLKTIPTISAAKTINNEVKTPQR
jgi:hypothetical protein